MTILQTTSPTFDDVWRTIQELAVMSKATDCKFQETDRMLKERSEETDRKFQETDRRFQETDRMLKERSAETDRKFQETDRMIKAVTRQLGAQGNRLGEFVQEMVRPAVVRLFRQRQLPVHQVMANLVSFDDNGKFRAEIDLLVIDSDIAVAVECKSHLSQSDVDEHLDRLALFKEYFPQYRGFTIMGAVAAMVLPQEIGRYAYRKGLFVLAQSGDAVEIRNDDSFKPQQW